MILEKNDIHMNFIKAEAVKNKLKSTNKKDCQAFLRTCEFLQMIYKRLFQDCNVTHCFNKNDFNVKFN